MQSVFVLGADRKALDPCHPARARKLLRKSRAAVYRWYPFTIILRDRTAERSVVHGMRMKLDPGSKTTGVALVREEDGKVLFGAEIQHRGEAVARKMQDRASLRRSRRNRKLRHRPPRFNNRRRPEGWLAPSMRSRVGNVTTWVDRLSRLCTITGFSIELAKFDTQKIEKPEISGIEYQQGELVGYEIREYLLEKWERKCAYCGKKGTPLEVEHIVPRSRQGSKRVSNLTLACHECNQAKGNRTAAEFGHPEVEKEAKAPLRDAAAINITRWSLYRMLQKRKLPLEVGTGGRTKWNRVTQGYPKAHWIDAACVGESGGDVRIRLDHQPLQIRATGRGTRQICKTDAYGFPKNHRTRNKEYLGWRTGDMAEGRIPVGNKHAGRIIGRVAIRQRPNFRIGKIDVHPKYLKKIQKGDGYAYNDNKKGGGAPPQG